jgi:hypothetical protein
MRLAWLVAPLVVLSACAATPAQPTTAASTASAPDPARAFDPNAPPRVEAPTFALELATPASTRANEPAPISITIEGRGEFHVNLEYPLRIELGSSDGARLAKSTLRAADARELSEARARFETDARWSRTGRQWLAARVQFAVCTPDTCVPREETVAISIDVQ